MSVLKFALFLFSMSQLVQIKCEVFSAISKMEDLITTQGKVFEIFDKYLEEQEANVKKMKRLVDSMRQEYETALEDRIAYIGNPVNSFRIIKQLNKDWPKIQTIMGEARRIFQKDFSALNESYVFPDNADMVGSAEAMLRLQHVYQLKTTDVAEGILNGVKYSSPLSSEDCFMLGLEVYKLKSYQAAQEWFGLAQAKYDEESILGDKFLIEEFMAYNEYQMGNVKESLDQFIELNKKRPNHPKIPGYIVKFQNILNDKNALDNIKPYKGDPHTVVHQNNYEELCREDLDKPESVKKLLKCRYVRTEMPYSWIGPFKVEEHYLSPYIVLFHDIIFDSEIQYLQDEVKPMLQRAKVNDDKGLMPSKARVSSNAFLSHDHHPVVTKINNRLQDATGLELKYAERVQLGNYGIGGFYKWHYDFTPRKSKNHFSKDPRGNRLATVLIYMTDVEQGGNTIFPLLGVSVRPRKGTAVFWYNLHSSGEGNTGTLHAACPVLKGDKWVLNKWIRLGGNEVTRPCNLIYQHEGKCSDYPPLVPTTH